MKPTGPARRAEDTGFLRLYEKWKVPSAALLGAVISIWGAVTWSDDKLRKIEQVPALEEAVLQLKVNQESTDRRLLRSEERQAKIENKLDNTQQEILEKLDVLVDQRTR